MALTRILIINIFLLLMLLLGKYMQNIRMNSFRVSNMKNVQGIDTNLVEIRYRQKFLCNPYLNEIRSTLFFSFSFCRPYFFDFNFLVTNNRSSLNACRLHQCMNLDIVWILNIIYKVPVGRPPVQRQSISTITHNNNYISMLDIQLWMMHCLLIHYRDHYTCQNY